MVNDFSGGNGQRDGAAVDPGSPTGMIFYRVVEDLFGDSEGADRTIDVVIQTTDPHDFADFDEAVEEAMDRIQERIDLEDTAEQSDRAHLALLEEKLGDSGEAFGADWEAYCYAVSQPTILMDTEEINLAEVEGRERFARLKRSGYMFSERELEVYSKLARQAECGAGTPKAKPKVLKPRPRPELDLAKVKIEPILAAACGPQLIRGLLARHKQLFESSTDWKPYHSGFVSHFDWPETSEFHIHVLTVFLDGGVCMTFAVAVPMGQLPPDERNVMERATVWLTTPEMN